ncbi:transcriptional regulator with XRE-family HTH domain [Rhizobium sp. SG_E_25_P2]|uniref:helix-turn-helix domain-containing protein n=1 Tax=Rhizobium sp. SG_E_25_P2 TaxID=2879942 RepID=UPI002474B846|nr:helix-turn-helix transcriptional regulator [Rhizobium sp. SG_E_25_P2]MDH6269238.1 transcriptional regulator with XRE-family HTH domain [Rhizobium sp. SG_E_25_P2]
MIDSEWFYRQLEANGQSIRSLGRAMGLDPSAVSRMLRGERKMSADEQDEIADYLGVPLSEIAARRRGQAHGMSERGQEVFKHEDDHAVGERGAGSTSASYLDRIRSKMQGTVTVLPGVDVTQPADPEWGRVYEDGHEYPIHL